MSTPLAASSTTWDGPGRYQRLAGDHHIHVVGVGCTVTDDTVVETRDYLRPVYADGLLTLHVTPAAAGTAVPLEVDGGHVCL